MFLVLGLSNAPTVFLLVKVEPPVGIEPTTCSLRMSCSAD